MFSRRASPKKAAAAKRRPTSQDAEPGSPTGRRPSAASPSGRPRRQSAIDFEGNIIDEDENAGNAIDPAVRRARAASEAVDLIFNHSLLKVRCPPRWKTLFIAAAKRLEKSLAKKREEMYTAAALDDVPSLERLRGEVPPLLWKWWSYDLDIVMRASARCRPEQLQLLPELKGKDNITAEAALLSVEAMSIEPYPGSPEDVRHQQRGDLLIDVIQSAIDSHSDIDVAKLQELLDESASGRWKTTLTPAIGVNYGARKDRFAGWRPLHFVAAAVTAGDSAGEACTVLLDARANPVLQDVNGSTALHVAAANNNVVAAEVLLRRGAPIETKDSSGCTALLLAARAKYSEIIRMLARWVLPKGSGVELWKAEAERISLRYSASRGYELHVEVARGDTDKVRTLITVGDGQGGDLADPNYVDSLGRSSLHIAVSSCSLDQRAAAMCRLLVSLRASVDLVDWSGDTPLHLAAQRQRLDVARTLLRLKAHPGVMNKEGKTPLMLAALTRGEPRPPPTYEGVLANKAFTWDKIAAVLYWEGHGDPPGPKIRKFRSPRSMIKDFEKESADIERGRGATVQPSDLACRRGEALASLGFDDSWIINQDGKINRGDRIQLSKCLFVPADSHGYPISMPKTRQASKTGPRTSTFSADFSASADSYGVPSPSNNSWSATGSIGGDSKQSGGQLWNRPRQCAPDPERMRLVWDNLTAPFLRLELMGKLPSRLKELLQYLLLSILGPRGPVFGLLTAAVIGNREAILPSWQEFETTLRKTKDLYERVQALRQLGFKGPAPKKAMWVGAVWARGDYPREPDTIPWGALVYADPEKATRLYGGAIQPVIPNCVVNVVREFNSDNDNPVLLQIGWRGRVRELDSEGDAYIKFDNHEIGQLVFKENFGNLQVEGNFNYEAFKGNWMPAFDEVAERDLPPSGARMTVFRGDQLQLANRLFVDEALGLCAVAEPRLKLIGSALLCPLLTDAARGLVANGVELDEIEERRSWLQYIATQTDEPHSEELEPTTYQEWMAAFEHFHSRRGPFFEKWLNTRNSIASTLGEVMPGVYELRNLTPYADMFLNEDLSMQKGKGQIPEQSSVLPAETLLTFTRQDSTRAFLELRRVNAVDSTEDFNTVVKGMAAKSPKYFADHFWRGSFYLLLWGRAQLLLPYFERELKNRIPDGAMVIGPTVRPRSDYLIEHERKVTEDRRTKRREDAHWLAWRDCERIAQKAVGRLGPEATHIRAEAKKINPRFGRHLRSWGNVAWTGEVKKPNADDGSLASGSGPPAARMLKKEAPKAVDLSVKNSKAATGSDGLPNGLTDVLKAQIVCDTVDVLRKAFEMLCKPPIPPKRPTPEQAKAMADEEMPVITSFRVLRIVNDFHKDQFGIATFPRTARILLLGVIEVRQQGFGAVPLKQLVEVEVVLPRTSEARWLADYLRLDPAEYAPGRDLPMLDEEEDGEGNATQQQQQRGAGAGGGGASPKGSLSPTATLPARSPAGSWSL